MFNLSKFIPKKKSESDIPVEPDTEVNPESGAAPADGAPPENSLEGIPDEQRKQVEADLENKAKDTQKARVIAIKPMLERVTKVNVLIIAVVVLLVGGVGAWFITRPSTNTAVQTSKAPEVKGNKAQQSSALADLQKAEQQKANGNLLNPSGAPKDGSVRSSAGSRPTDVVNRSGTAAGSSGTAAASRQQTTARQMTEEEKEAAADRKAAKDKAAKAQEQRAAEDRAGVRSDIFFNIDETKGVSASRQEKALTVNDYYNNSYTPSSDDNYVQVVESSSGSRSQRIRR